MKKFIILLYFMVGVSLFLNAQETVYGNQRLVLEISVIERESEMPIDGVNVYLFDKATEDLLDTKITDNGGRVYFDIMPQKSYEVHTCKSTYINGGVEVQDCYDEANNTIFCLIGAHSFDFASAGGDDKEKAMISAQIAIDEIVVGKTFKLDNIYFDLDKARLKSSAKKELDYVYQILTQYPTMTIELSSHTDSRASNEYNDKLSQRRAQSTYDYLVTKGIDPSRLVAKGYGETQLVNECADGVKCSEAKHRMNRRTEFKVLTFEGAPCPAIPTMRMK